MGGTFAAADSGVAVGYENCVLVPVAQSSGFVSQPLARRPIDVSVGDDHAVDIPERTIGATVRAGLRLSLAPSTCRQGEQASWLTAGFAMTWVADSSSDGMFGGFGLGLEVPL